MMEYYNKCENLWYNKLIQTSYPEEIIKNKINATTKKLFQFLMNNGIKQNKNKI